MLKTFDQGIHRAQGIGFVLGVQILNFRIFFYPKSSKIDLPGQFEGFETLSYEKISRFGIENTPRNVLDAIFRAR